MKKIWLARGTHLPVMRLPAKIKGTPQFIAIYSRIIGFNFLVKIVRCFNHLRAKLIIKVTASR
jgi:hypothetical protein